MIGARAGAHWKSGGRKAVAGGVTLLDLVLAGLAYGPILLFSTRLFGDPSAGVVVWPPAGVAAALVAWRGWQLWPALLAGGVAGIAGLAASPLDLAGEVLLATCAAMIGGELFRGLRSRVRTSSRSRSEGGLSWQVSSSIEFVVWVLAAGVVAPFCIEAMRLVAAAISGGVVPGAVSSALVRWAGHFTGVVAAGTAVLIAIQSGSAGVKDALSMRGAAAVSVAVAGLAVGLAAAHMGTILGYPPWLDIAMQVLLLCVVASAFLLGSRGVALAVLCALLFVGFVSSPAGLAVPYPGSPHALQLYLAVLALLGFGSGCAIEEISRLRCELKLNRMLHLNIMDAVRDGVAILGPDGALLDANQKMEEIVGLPWKDLSGRSIGDPNWILWREDGTPVGDEERPSNLSLFGGQKVAPSLFRTVSSKREAWVEISSLPMRGESGVVLGAIATLRDVTGDMVLRTAAEKGAFDFRRVADEIPNLIYMTDQDGNTVYHNKAWGALLLGDESRSAHTPWRDFLFAGDSARVIEVEDAAVARRERYEELYRMRRHDGELVWFLDIGVPRFDDAGVFLGYIGCMTDVDEAQRFRLRIGAMADIALKGELLRARMIVVAEGLAGLRAEIDAGKLSDQAMSRPQLLHAMADLERIARAANTDGLPLRCGEPDCPLEVRSISVAEKVSRSVELLSPLLGQSHRIRLDIDSRARLDACPELIHSLVASLVVNARDAMSSGGEIEISVCDLDAKDVGWWSPRGAGWIKIQVLDSGCGIAAGDLPEIMKPFWTRKDGAIGMGLTMVDMAARSIGGRVDIESTVGRGTRVSVFLPASDGGSLCLAGRGATTVASGAPAGTQLPVGHGEKVLVRIEDADLGLVLSEQLRRLGYEAILGGGSGPELDCGVDLVVAEAPIGLSERDAAVDGSAPDRRPLWIGRPNRHDLEDHGLIGASDIYIRAPYRLADLAFAVRDGVARGRAQMWKG